MSVRKREREKKRQITSTAHPRGNRNHRAFHITTTGQSFPTVLLTTKNPSAKISNRRPPNDISFLITRLFYNNYNEKTTAAEQRYFSNIFCFNITVIVWAYDFLLQMPSFRPFRKTVRNSLSLSLSSLDFITFFFFSRDE